MCVQWLSAISKLCVHYLTNIAEMCVHLLSTAVCTFARRPSAASADPATVTLVNILANIFVCFQYPVNKFERPGSELYLFEKYHEYSKFNYHGTD